MCAFYTVLCPPAYPQTNPEPFDLSTGDYTMPAWHASEPAGSYPQHIRFHRGPRQDPRLSDEPNADYIGDYQANAGSRMNGLGAEGFSWRNIGTAGDLGAAVLALNTIGISNILVSWTGGTVDAPGRDYRIRLQYRIGTTGTFTDVPGPIEYAASSAGDSRRFGPTLLAAETHDQPVVQLRWKYYYESGTGSRPQLRVGDILVQSARHPGNGTGTASISRDIFRGGVNQSFEISVSGSNDTIAITHVDILFPDWATELAPEHVSVSDPDAIVMISESKVRISNTEITLERELIVSIIDLPLPDVTGEYTCVVRTGVDTDKTHTIAQSPTVRIWGTPVPIKHVSENDAEGISVHAGSWKTIRGTVTVSDQFESGSGDIGTGSIGPSFVQDATGGLAVFSPSGVSSRVSIGEEVTIMGKVTQFFGLNQLDESALVVDSHGIASVEPTVVTLADISADGAGGLELYEGMLVRLNGVTVHADFWTVGGAGTNYILRDTDGQLEVRINKAVDFAGRPAPSGRFDIVGVVSQFRSQPPYIGGYQLMPRYAADILFDSDAPPIVSLPPYETAATESTVTLSWRTGGPGTSEVRYGLTTGYELGAIVQEDLSEEHTLIVGGLQPATVYNLQIRSAAGGDTTISGNYPVVTRSSGASQEINVYFNQTIDVSLAAEGPARIMDFSRHLISRIQNARHSIDLALYSISGETGNDIAGALISARDDGVRVRIIMDRDRILNSSTGIMYDRMIEAGIAVAAGGYNYGQIDSGIHHNKFVVIDYHGGTPEEIWAITGSWNATDEGTYNHYQNLIEFQDVSIANAYTREFEQMWGSAGSDPDPGNSKFGAEKNVVSPTVFWIGDAYVRLFFSPQGFGSFGTVENQIIRTLGRSEYSINLGLNLITRSTIVEALKNRYDQGVTVRGVIGDISVTGSQFQNLGAWGDVLSFPQAFGLLHHKYAIIDSEDARLNGAVITGSHNWSRAANERNDENTVVIYHPVIVNHYLQEFSARYRQAGGEDELIIVSIDESATAIPDRFFLSQNFPNPFNPATRIVYGIPEEGRVRMELFNPLGQKIRTLVDLSQSAGTYAVAVDVEGIAGGVYFYRLSFSPYKKGNARTDTFVETKRMVVVR